MKSLKTFIFLAVASAQTLVAATLVRPEGSEFQVVFPEKPTVSKNAFLSDDGTEGHSLNAALTDETGFFRAEFLVYGNPEAIRLLTDEEIKNRSIELAKHNGLRVSDFSVARENGHRIARLRGTKILPRTEGDLSVTYQIVVLYGEISMVSLTVGAPSAIFPTREIVRFLESAK